MYTSMNLANTYTPITVPPIDPATTIEALASITPPSVMSDVFPLLPENMPTLEEQGIFPIPPVLDFPEMPAVPYQEQPILEPFDFWGDYPIDLPPGLPPTDPATMP